MPEPAMISVDEARTRILAGLHPMPAEIVALANAWHRVTAEPVIARLTQPPSDVSAMDGYALRAADGGLHASLRVIGAAPAGHPFDGEVGPGETVRLFTGSVVPRAPTPSCCRRMPSAPATPSWSTRRSSPAGTSAAPGRIFPRATR